MRVGSAIAVMLMSRLRRRPTLSPTWPNRMAPRGPVLFFGRCRRRRRRRRQSVCACVCGVCAQVVCAQVNRDQRGDRLGKGRVSCAPLPPLPSSPLLPLSLPPATRAHRQSPSRALTRDEADSEDGPKAERLCHGVALGHEDVADRAAQARVELEVVPATAAAQWGRRGRGGR